MKSNFNTEKIYYRILEYNFYIFPLLIIIGSALVNFSLILVSLMYIFVFLKNKDWAWMKEKESKIFLLIYLYLVFNSLISDQILISLIRTVPYLKFFLFVLVYKQLIEKNIINLKKLSYIWSIILLCLCLDIFFQSFFGFNVFGYDSGNPVRNSGFFFDELVAGAFLLCFSFICIFLVKKIQNNLISLLFLIVFLLGTLLSGERSNFIKFFLIFLVSVYYFKNIGLKNFLKIFIMFIVVASSIFLSQGEKIKSRYFATLSFSHDNLGLLDTYLTSSYGAHALSAYFVFKDNFYLGVGNKNFRYECQKYDNQVLEFQNNISSTGNATVKGCSTHPHQFYYEILSEHGFIGTLFFMYLLISLILQRIKQRELSIINIVAFLYIMCVFLPILPSGSFFTTYSSTLFWINVIFFLTKTKNLNV